MAVAVDDEAIGASVAQLAAGAARVGVERAELALTPAPPQLAQQLLLREDPLPVSGALRGLDQILQGFKGGQADRHLDRFLT
jgi:hypothetical protein